MIYSVVDLVDAYIASYTSNYTLCFGFDPFIFSITVPTQPFLLPFQFGSESCCDMALSLLLGLKLMLLLFRSICAEAGRTVVVFPNPAFPRGAYAKSNSLNSLQGDIVRVELGMLRRLDFTGLNSPADLAPSKA